MIGPSRRLPDLVPGIDLARRLCAADAAFEDGAALKIEHAAVAGLSTRDAALIGLPPFAEVLAALSTRGVMTRPDFEVELAWTRIGGQSIVGAERCGAWLATGAIWQRLPHELYTIAERVDELEAAAGDQSTRMRALAALREVLPDAEAAGRASSSGIIGKIKIAVADAFSLDLTDEGARSRLVPILHLAGQDAPLLPPEQQRAFGDDQFNRFTEARSLYSLGGGSYVVLTPPLHRALAKVRRVQSAPLATRRALLAAPLAFLRQALGDEADATVLDNLVRETPAYAERVLGLGLWQARVLPWITLAGNNWLDGEVPQRAATPKRGLLVGDDIVPLTTDQVAALRTEVGAAMAANRSAVPFVTDGRTIAIPANAETLVALAALEQPPAGGAKKSNQAPAPQVLLIASNESEVDAEAGWTPPRPTPDAALPSCLRTPLMAHQSEGLRWLQQAWARGQPGVLLADDMGLGKTLQALAFFAWLREGMRAGRIRRAPLLIVAPTGLLENWRQEHDRHLANPGLGEIFGAYGKDLAAHRRPDADGRPCIDPSALRDADCVLTTYETLRDHDRDFGQVRFAALAFDEAQKIKTPGIRLTDAAKAMNAEFRLALTGTPVENRLGELWCIVDTVHPAFLGDLKGFSARYERSPEATELRSLKDLLDRPRSGRPALMLRRLRRDHLPDLPRCEEMLIEEPMPPVQQAAYDDAIGAARTADPGGMLKALAALRTVSLHPAPDPTTEDEAFIAASARLRITFRILDTIRKCEERALIFINDRNMQARLVALIQRRYRLPAPPMIINGEVPGAIRQAQVNRFQADHAGFDVMILSPRAGGVGLTLTGANHVIHLDRWWNPAIEDQCTGRVLRIGQIRPVSVHIPQAVCSGRRSFDINLHALLQRKRELFRDTLMPAEMSASEALALARESVAG